MKPITLVIFDCDGVVIDSEIIAARIESEVKTELGHPISIQDQIREFVGNGFNSPKVQAVVKSLPPGYPALAAQRKNEAFRNELVSMSGVREVIENLKQDKCIASGSNPARLELTLKITNLWDYFPHKVFSASMVKRGKPAPDLFLLAAKTLGHKPENCLVIEDSAVGVEAARAAEMTVLGYVGGTHVYPELAEKLNKAGAKHVFSHWNEFPALLDSIEKADD